MMVADKEHEHELHHIDWPMFMSADDRQKMLQGKILRAAQYLSGLQDCPVAQRRNFFDVNSRTTESTRQPQDL